MSRMLLRVLFLVLAFPLAQASAAVDPAPLFSREPAFSEKVRQLVADAEKSLRTGDKQEALHKLNLAASLEPDNPYVVARLAVVQNMSGNFQDALDRLKRARKLGAPSDVVLPPMLEAMIAMGQNQNVLDLFPDPGASSTYTAGLILRARASALQMLGDKAGATAAMKRSLAILNDYSGIMTAARIALLQGDYDTANARADAALKLKAGDIEARMLKIDVVLQRRNFAAARQMADTLAANSPNSASALLMRIKTYVVSERPDVVEPEVDRLLAQAPDFMLARYFKAMIVGKRGDIKGAWDLAQGLPKEYFQADPGIALNVANMALGAGFIDSGATILSVAVQRFPYLLEPRLLLTEIRLHQKSPQYALNTLTMLRDSQDPRVLVLFARAYLMKRDPDTARKYILQAIETGGGEELRSMDKDVALKSLGDYSAVHPANRLVRKQYALLLLGFGELAKARTAYEQLLRDDPADAVALNNLSWLVVKDDPARALSLAQRAVKADPASANYLDTLGTMQMNRPDFKAAVLSLRKAHELAPDNPTISYHLALALEGAGEGARSQTLLQALVKRGGFGDLEAAKSLLASKLQMAGQTQVGR
ncbi:MAG TPA: tetratricopeptide repeat protein [Rhizomicrobium sp.]|nr:tetratricopeptide repeat protein [Rhizomicrobium sp.]